MMRKLILGVAAVAALALPSIASADTPRYQSQSATFTMVQPAGAYHQFDNVWTHDFTVTSNPCNGSFEGTGVQTGSDQNGPYTNTWTIAGTFGAGNTASFTATRADGLVLSLDNAPMDSATVSIATLNVSTPDVIEEKLSKPVFANTSNYRNHGEYVRQAGDRADAAHSCIGMPIVSGAGA